MTCCLFSECYETGDEADFENAIGIFTRDICPSRATQEIIDSAGVSSRDITAAEIQERAEKTPTPSNNDTGGSSRLSTGTLAGIAIAAACGVGVIAIGIFLYLRRKRKPGKKKSSVEGGKVRISRPQQQDEGAGKRQISRPRQQQQQPHQKEEAAKWPSPKRQQQKKEQDTEHKQEQKQLQQQLQKMQDQLRKKKLKEEDKKQKKVDKEQSEEKEERKYVAELFELPGWMPERQNTMNELADTGHPRYEMSTEANTAELSGGTPVRDNNEGRPYEHYPRRFRSYTAELAGASVHLSDDELTPLKRSHSDGWTPVSSTEHVSPDYGQVHSPCEVSPPTATVPARAFFRGDWRSGEGDPAAVQPLNPHPPIPLGLDTSARGLVQSAGRRAKGRRGGGVMVAGRVTGDADPEAGREAWT